MKTSGVDSPGVRVYPIVYFAVGLLLGWLASLAIPMPLPGPVPERLGMVLVGIGLVLGLMCWTVMRRAGVDPRPDRPAVAFVINGPYRYSRNPMYIGMILIYLGLAMWTHWLVAVPLLAGVVALLQRRVIAQEEAYMERRFGDHYRRYKIRVPRWV